MRTEALPESEIGQRVSVARVEGLGRERYVNVARAEWCAYRAMVFDMVVRGGFEVCPSSHGMQSFDQVLLPRNETLTGSPIRQWRMVLYWIFSGVRRFIEVSNRYST